MVETFNYLLYAITLLFGVEAPIYSTYSEMNIDVVEKSIEIIYFELEIPADYVEGMSMMVGYLDSLNSLGEDYSGLTLISNSYLIENNKYNYHLNLKFDDAAALRNYFKIDFDSMQLFVHSNENVTINSNDTFNTNNFSGELYPFNSTPNSKYSFKYEWDYSGLSLNLIPLTQ